MRTIQIHIEYGQWFATHMMDGLPDTETISMFGTHILLTPFNATAPKEMVLATLNERNPGVAVCVS